MTVREGEIGGVVGHGVTLGGDAHASVGHGEIGDRVFGHGYALDGVAFLSRRCGVERILQFQVGVERIVFGRNLVFRHTVVQGDGHLGLVGEELAHLETGRDGIAA